MARRSSAYDPFHHPATHEVNYTRMLDAMRNCHAEVLQFMQYCGARNPVREDAQALLEHLKAIAALTRVSGATAIVAPPILDHSIDARPPANPDR